MTDKTPKHIIREELHKLSGLSWRQRLGYIWDYYKPLMAALLAVIFLVCMGVEIYHNKQIERLLNVHLINSGDPLADSSSMAADFAEYIGGIEDKQEISMDATMTLGDELDQTSTANQTKFMVLAGANELELLLMDEETFERYAAQGFFADLEELLSAEELEEWSARLIYREKAEEAELSDETETEQKMQHDSATEIAAAIDLTDSEVLQEYGVYTEGKVYGGVFARAEYKELYGQFFEFLLRE